MCPDQKKLFAYLINVLFLQNVESEDYWEKLAQESDPSSQQKEPINHTTIVPPLKSKLLAFKAQVIRCIFHLGLYPISSGALSQFSSVFLSWHLARLTKCVSSNRWGSCATWFLPLTLRSRMRLVKNLDCPASSLICSRMLLKTWVSLRLVLQGQKQIQQGSSPANVCANCFCSSLQQPRSVPALGEMLVTLRIYWEKHHDWAKDEQRLDYHDVCHLIFLFSVQLFVCQCSCTGQ